MQRDKHEIDEPVNVEERYMYAMVARLDALCHMVSSLVEHIAQKEGVAVEKSTVTRKRVTKTKE